MNDDQHSVQPPRTDGLADEDTSRKSKESEDTDARSVEDATDQEVRLAEQLDAAWERLTTSDQPRSDSVEPAEVEPYLDVLGQLSGLSLFLGEPVGDDKAVGTSSAAHEATQSFDGDVEQGPVGVQAKRIGKYHVVRMLGQGGQAITYLAEDPDLRRQVVLKCYQSIQSEADQATVLNEGQSLARVRSPYVAQCFGAERGPRGLPFLVLEYVRGRSLADELRRRDIPLGESLRLVSEVAEGLSAVHACGLIHRDIKPANILIDDAGQPRLVDFGLAEIIAGNRLLNVAGTPAYMAPEQARGDFERIDARTDIYGLGAVLYELLTKERPHQGRTSAELLAAARQDDIRPPIEIDRELPTEVNSLCLRCLARDPAKRFYSARELQQAIQSLRIAPLTGAWARRLPVRLAVVGVFAAVLLFAIWAAVRDGNDRPDRNRETLANVTEPGGAAGQAETRRDIGGETLQAQPDPQPAAVESILPEMLFSRGRRQRQDFDLDVQINGAQRNADGLLMLEVDHEVVFDITPARDAYIGIWYLDESGVIVQLFPNEFDADHHLVAGVKRRIPNNEQYAIQVTPASQPETIFVIAASNRWDPGELVGPYRVFATATERQTFTQSLTRGLKLTPKSSDGETNEISEVAIPFQVGPR